MEFSDGAVKFGAAFAFEFYFAPSFSAASWQNLHKFNAKFAAIKFAVLFGLTALNLARLF